MLRNIPAIGFSLLNLVSTVQADKKATQNTGDDYSLLLAGVTFLICMALPAAFMHRPKTRTNTLGPTQPAYSKSNKFPKFHSHIRQIPYAGNPEIPVNIVSEKNGKAVKGRIPQRLFSRSNSARMHTERSANELRDIRRGTRLTRNESSE